MRNRSDAASRAGCADPHSGEVLALVGGRNYGISQLNHADRQASDVDRSSSPSFTLRRSTLQLPDRFWLRLMRILIPESISETPGVFTPASLIDDSQVSIVNGDEVYEPRNYHDAFNGEVTARYALAMSLNNATVRLAQEVGFDKVAALAKQAGIASVRATPSIALGSYDATPVEMAGAYTVFANGGTRLSPLMVKSVRDASGNVMNDYHSDGKDVLDPRVTYVLTTMMEAVVNNGTGYPVRARGFTSPAAGKTGTSHDAWFAGYTSNLLCIVWVGNDDYTDIKLAGGAAAAPIWAEFMKRAVKLPQYSDVKDFSAPSRSRDAPDRQGYEPDCDAVLPAGLHGCVYRWNGTEGDLRSGFRRSSRLLHQDLRDWLAAGKRSTAQHQWLSPAGNSRRAERSKPANSPNSRRADEEEKEGFLQPALWPRRQRGRNARRRDERNTKWEQFAPQIGLLLDNKGLLPHPSKVGRSGVFGAGEVGHGSSPLVQVRRFGLRL